MLKDLPYWLTMILADTASSLRKRNIDAELTLAFLPETADFLSITKGVTLSIGGSTIHLVRKDAAMTVPANNDFSEFNGGEMESCDVLIPGDTNGSLVYGCSHNSKGNLIAATKLIHFAWTNGSDEPSFEWLLELHDGRFLCVEGWHDYTGWDCQSGVSVCAVENTLAAAARHLTDDARRDYEARGSKP